MHLRVPKDTRMEVLRWAWWALAVAALSVGAWMGRYTDIRGEGAPASAWDRWLHRACVFTQDGTLCFGPDRTWPVLRRPRRPGRP